jgi:hypothetical protein
MDWKIIFIILICLFIGFIAGAVRERVLVSEKFTIEFALWLSVNCEIGTSRDGWYIYQNKEWLCVNECLDKFKEERLKTV